MDPQSIIALKINSSKFVTPLLLIAFLPEVGHYRAMLTSDVAAASNGIVFYVSNHLVGWGEREREFMIACECLWASRYFRHPLSEAPVNMASGEELWSSSF